MSLIIDGYNLLHASGILGGGKSGVGSLERSRHALLNFLVESLSDRELERAIVVFDAAEAPPGLPRVTSHRSLSVQFASPHHANADELIEELIRADPAPRKLTVVSSDHRIQRAANRRKATAVDSDKWFAERLRQRLAPRGGPTADVPKPSGPLSTYQVAQWLKHFGMEATPEAPAGAAELHGEMAADSEEPNHSSAAATDTTTKTPSDKPTRAKRPRTAAPRRRRKPSGQREKPKPRGDLQNPFPPGYGEDLLGPDD